MVTKKYIVTSCIMCPHCYISKNDPYPDVGWAMDKCKMANKPFWGPGKIGPIPDWCPLPNN